MSFRHVANEREDRNKRLKLIENNKDNNKNEMKNVV